MKSFKDLIKRRKGQALLQQTTGDESFRIISSDPEENLMYRYPNNYVQTSKYTVFTFLPKNITEQFMRAANFYFLIISALQLIDGLSPTGKYTTLFPLVIVLSITALKEIYEDVKRHRQDKQMNTKGCFVLDGKKFKETSWEKLMVGNLVCLKNGDLIPADLILLSSSESMGMAYVETSQLDGETNLKIRQSLEETVDLFHQDKTDSMGQNKFEVNCEHPNPRLYVFEGNITVASKKYPLENKQILLRGAQLRNTKWAIGVVVYSGKETKLMKNASNPPIKRSSVEKLTNYSIVFLFLLEICLALICAICSVGWLNSNVDTAWYLNFDGDIASAGFLNFLTCVILFNNLIPISLYVSMEIVKVFQAYFINVDLDMYHRRTKTFAQARTSNLNEELGQVKYIFSDKTGTLTQNLMEFCKCSIAGVKYGTTVTEASKGAMERDSVSSSSSSSKKVEQNKKGKGNTNKDNKDASPKSSPPIKSKTAFENDDDDDDISHFNFQDDNLLGNLRNGHETANSIAQFLELLSVCHTVIPEKDDDGNITYQAASPDEGALVAAAKELGYEFVTRSPTTVSVDVDGKGIVEYKILNVLEFNSTRKRMSVIIEDPKGNLKLLCKGADTVIYERLGPNQPFADITIKHLQDFACEGLRTLCLSYADLERENYEKWSQVFYEASIAVSEREKKLDKAAEMIEKNLMLIGATAIEDKLQDGVPEAIFSLAKAGIKIWVLTGDKQETAINIGFACKLLTQDMDLVVVNESDYDATLQEFQRKYEEFTGKELDGDLALIVDGTTLGHALTGECSQVFLKLAKLCKAVVCCRCSPAQKAEVVKLVKRNSDEITLAIGDGANDVSMIMAAHVGVGISGEEGLQAARSSDYSIAQFRFLNKLLLVHGRFAYRRICKLILYSFYKNIALYLCQFWYTFFSGFSGVSLFERWTLATYNVFFTFIPVIVFGIFDKDVNDEMVISYPKLYKSGPARKFFNFRVFWEWMFNGVWQSAVLFFLPLLAMRHDLYFSNGQTGGLYTVGLVVYSCVVITVTLRLAIETRYWTIASHIFYWGCLLLYVIFGLVYGTFWGNKSINMGQDAYHLFNHLLRMPVFYFILIIVPIFLLSRDFAWKYYKRTYLPQLYHIMQEVEKGHAKDLKKNPLDSSQHLGRSNLEIRAMRLQHYTGFSFSQETGQADFVRGASSNK